MPIAEELCGDHFHLPAFDLGSAPYDVVTARDLFSRGVEPPPEISQLAEVRRCDLTREERTARDRRRTHYRICLWDPNILRVCDHGPPHGAVLLYVLCHELVHIVRFAKQLARFDTTPDDRSDEECKVHDITSIIVKKAREPGLVQLMGQMPAIGGCMLHIERRLSPRFEADP